MTGPQVPVCRDVVVWMAASLEQGAVTMSVFLYPESKKAMMMNRKRKQGSLILQA